MALSMVQGWAVLPGASALFAAAIAAGGARRPTKTRLIPPSSGGLLAYRVNRAIGLPVPVRPGTGFPAMNDFSIKPFDFQAAVARAGLRPDGTPRIDGVDAASGGGFRSAMADALKDVSQSQIEADRLQRELSLDNPAVSLEQTMMAMQKAQIGFQATLQVRNRLAQAYSDIMNMQV
jgi:flagellar hook-basal body complex protein FliE